MVMVVTAVSRHDHHTGSISVPGPISIPVSVMVMMVVMVMVIKLGKLNVVVGGRVRPRFINHL